MACAHIRPAEATDAGPLSEALAHLSDDLGDRHRASATDILRHGFGDHPAFRAELAEQGGTVVGVVVFSAVFSTVQGGPGLYVSDLWVAPATRGSGLARRLLAAAWRTAASAWGAGFLRVGVYADNQAALGFYRHLGFREVDRDRLLILAGTALQTLDRAR